MTRRKFDLRSEQECYMRPAGKMQNGLYAFAKEFGGGTLVEVGVFRGESTRIFRRYFDHVLAIDPWERGGDILEGRTEKVDAVFDMRHIRQDATRMARKYTNIALVHAFDHEVEPFVGMVDGVYLDAIHTDAELTRQIGLWLPHCKRFIAGHDYHSRDFPEVTQAVDRWFPSVLAYGDMTWVRPLTS